MEVHPLSKSAGPWYREPWPWILMGLPATVVIAGIITLVIAVKHEDGLVAEDYYKQGLEINRVLERESTAAALGLEARIMFSPGKMRVGLEGQQVAANSLVARFVHPTRSGLDREVVLSAIAPGWYEGQMPQLTPGRWRIQLENDDATWRMTQQWLTTEQSLSITAGGEER